MADEKSPLDLALEVFVYLPLGAVAQAREDVPKLIERGRQQVTQQVTTARFIGQFAVEHGQKEVTRRIDDARKLLSGLGLAGRPDAPAPAPPAAAGGAASDTPLAVPSAPPPTANGPRPDDDALAIPGYDALSASQVVQRLDGLGSDELEAVRAYEAATRGRRTILNKIGQLQAAANGR